MKKLLTMLIVVVVIIGNTTSCVYRYQLKTGLPPSDQEVTQWYHIGMWGYANSAPFNLEQACP